MIGGRGNLHSREGLATFFKVGKSAIENQFLQVGYLVIAEEKIIFAGFCYHSVGGIKEQPMDYLMNNPPLMSMVSPVMKSFSISNRTAEEMC